MLTEMLGKGGRVCEPARRGDLRCPLIARPTSEDLITGNLFGALGLVSPRWWVADLLNTALGTPRFRRQFYRSFRIELWNNRSHYPRELLPWKEGSTQVDVTLRWENPPTTVFIEAKFLASLASTTANGDRQREYPSDQVIRNIRVGLWECGWFRGRSLFSSKPRDFVMLLLTPLPGEKLIQHYRDACNVRRAIPHNDQLTNLPRQPFVGEIGYRQLIENLRKNQRHASPIERRIVQQSCSYLAFKLRQFEDSRSSTCRQKLRQQLLSTH